MWPGRNDSMRISASSARRLNLATPAGSVRSTTTLRLLTQYAAQNRDRSAPGRPSTKGPRRRVGLPPGGSTLMTSAPKSASTLPHQLKPPSVRSRTMQSERGCGACLGCDILQESHTEKRRKRIEGPLSCQHANDSHAHVRMRHSTDDSLYTGPFMADATTPTSMTAAITQ